MPKNCLYLVSSSANREYVLDCVEALALPRGMILHFRYRFKYVDEKLRASLPSEGGTLPAALRNLPVVVVYLYQVQTIGVWKPGDTMGPGGPYLPLRCGRLINAFKDGEIAHFFFELTGYVKPKYRRRSTRVSLNEKIKFRVARGKAAPVSYAHFSHDLGFEGERASDEVAFQSIVDDAYLPGEWRTRSLGSAPLDVTYEVVFLRVAGLFQERTAGLAEVAPVLRIVRGNSFAEYEFEADTTYHIKLVTHLSARIPAAIPGKGRAMLRLAFDPEYIKPIGPTSLRISSLYDLEYWSFVTKTSTTARSALSITCDYDPVVEPRDFVRSELLCPEVSLPISIVAAKGPTQRGKK
jgi:hypothetical protein